MSIRWVEFRDHCFNFGIGGEYSDNSAKLALQAIARLADERGFITIRPVAESSGLSFPLTVLVFRGLVQARVLEAHTDFHRLTAFGRYIVGKDVVAVAERRSA